MLMLLHWASSKGTTGLEIFITTLGREGQEAACTLLDEMLLPTASSPDARYCFPLEKMNYIVTLNCGDMFPQSSLDKSNSTGSPVRQVLPVAMPASWPIEESMPVSCRFFYMHIYLFSFKFCCFPHLTLVLMLLCRALLIPL
ncbi:hypothetical protein ACQJBY_059130 [Aegilops geniculata]